MTTTTLTTERLTEIERADLVRLEQTFLKGIREAAQALKQLHDRRLYRETHTSFRDYCREVFRITASRAYQLIVYEEVMEELRQSTDVDTNDVTEEMTRHLVKAPQGQRAEVYRRAKANGNGRATPELCRAAVNGRNGNHVADLPKKFHATKKDKQSAQNWWYMTKKPEVRGEYFEVIIGMDKPVTVTNLKEFKERVLRWLDTVQEQKVFEQV